MKKFVFAASAAASLVALSACGDNTATPTEEATPIVTETMLDTPPSVAAANEAASQGDSVSIGEDGVQATINDGNTSVNIDADRDPSLDVQVD